MAPHRQITCAAYLPPVAVPAHATANLHISVGLAKVGSVETPVFWVSDDPSMTCTCSYKRQGLRLNYRPTRSDDRATGLDNVLFERFAFTALRGIYVCRAYAENQGLPSLKKGLFKTT
jgi:hypothetical protein